MLLYYSLLFYIHLMLYFLSHNILHNIIYYVLCYTNMYVYITYIQYICYSLVFIALCTTLYPDINTDNSKYNYTGILYDTLVDTVTADNYILTHCTLLTLLLLITPLCHFAGDGIALFVQVQH